MAANKAGPPQQLNRQTPGGQTEQPTAAPAAAEDSPPPVPQPPVPPTNKPTTAEAARQSTTAIHDKVPPSAKTSEGPAPPPLTRHGSKVLDVSVVGIVAG